MMTAIHIVSNLLMFGGLFIIARGWHQVHRAQGALVTIGLYRWIRHPQYSGLFLITIGLLIQWPTIITALTWPILVAMYVRLARREEGDMERQFGDAYRAYAARVPRFVPHLSRTRGSVIPISIPENRPGWQIGRELPAEDRAKS
jgi:protein-S-isoprenylcysteine O-methyltransferase Ste14